MLTFGWELAPILSGGLGVACAGLVRAMVAEGARVTFVLPKLPRPVDVPGVEVVDAREAAPRTSGHPEAHAAPDPDAGLERIPVDTPLAPYQGHASYAATLAGLGDRLAGREGDAGPSGLGPVLYGGDLLAEVERFAAAAAQVAARSPHDVIHCHDWMTFEAGLAAREVSGRPLVLHVHSTEADRSGGGDGDPRIRAREARGLEAADLVVAVSEFTRRRLIAGYGLDPDRVVVVHNGIEDTTHREAAAWPSRPGRKRPTVLFLGRLTAQKGPGWFLDAAARVAAARPDAVFLVAGGGELLPWMVERAAALGIGDRVRFAGFLSGADIDRAYAMADVFVMPSVSEPFGLVPLEAMLRGTPAIVSRQSGVSEVLRHCLKVDFWDTDDLADKIVAVLDHPALSGTLAAAGRSEAEALGWELPARRLLDLLAGIAASQRRYGRYNP